MAKKIGIQIELDGAREFKEEIKSANSAQKELRSEMKLVAQEFDGQSNSLEALSAKYEILQKQYDAQAEKVEAYKGLVEQWSKAQEDAGQNVNNLQSQLEEESEKLDEIKKTLGESSEEYKNQQEVVSGLSRELDAAEETYDKTTRALESWQTSLNNATYDLNTLQKSLEEVEGYMEEAKNSSDGLATSIDGYGKRVAESKEQTLDFGDVMKANIASDVVMAGLEKIVGLLKEAGAELLSCATSAAEYADNINTLSKQTGVATSTLQELTYAEELMDVSVSTVTQSMARNIRAMNSARDGAENYAEAYQRLGIEVTDANGNLRDGEEVFWELIDALHNMDNAAERDATSMQLLGRNAQSLNTLISIGSEGFQKFAKEARDAGYVLDQKTLDSLNDVSDSMERMGKRIDVVKNNIGRNLAPVMEDAFDTIAGAVEDAEDPITELAEEVIPALAKSLEWIVDNSDIIVSVATGVAGALFGMNVVVPVIEALGVAWEAYSAYAGGAATATEALNMVMEANPAVFLATALVGVCTALGTYIAFFAEAGTETGRFIEQNEKAIDSLKESAEARKEESDGVEQNAKYADKLVDSIAKLNEKEKLSSAEKAKLKKSVDELNKIYPELNLSIDEETGKLEGNTSALEDNIKAQKEKAKLEAVQEKYAEAIKQTAEAELNLEDTTSKRIETEQKLAAATEQMKQMQADYAGQVTDTGESILLYDANYQALLSSIDTYKSEITDLTEQEAEYNGVISSNNDEIGEYSAKIDSITGAMDEQAEATKNNAEASVQYGDTLITIKGLSEDTAQSINDLAGKYAEAKSAAYDSLTSQVGLFDEIKVKSELTVDQMKANIDTQTAAFDAYNSNLQTLQSSNNAGVKAILDDVSKLGMDGAGYVKELADALQNTPEKVDALVESFNKMQESKKTLSETLADIDTGFSETLESLGVNIEGTTGKVGEEAGAMATSVSEAVGQVEQAIATSSATQLETVQTTVSDMNASVDEGGNTLNATVESMMDSIESTVTQKLGYASGTSSVYYKFGKSIPDSLAEGVKDGTSALGIAISQMIEEATTSAINKLKSAKSNIDRALGEAL